MRAEIPVTAGAVSVVVLREISGKTQVLLLERADSLVGEWCPVAGGLEPNETAWQGALREVKEETGLVPERLFSADFCEQFYVAAQDMVLIIPVFVAYVGSEAVVLNHEHSDYKWMDLKAAWKRVPFAGQRRVLKHVKRNFVKRNPSKYLQITLKR